MMSTRSYDAVTDWQAAAELQPLVKNWWMMARRGMLAALFGATIALGRIPVLYAVIVPFGTYAIADGIRATASALRAARPRMKGWPIALEGIVSVVLGVLAFTWPFLPRAAIGVPGGACSVFLALVVLGMPHAGSEGVALALAAYAIAFGIVILLASLRFHLAASTLRSQRVRV